MGLFSQDEQPMWSDLYQNHKVKDETIAMLEELKQSLIIEAAEYIPAIPEAWTAIDAIIAKLKGMR